ncbi:MAG: hypothetical protein RTV72_06655 [Candidatus Thorarchaeota archaeon]
MKPISKSILTVILTMLVLSFFTGGVAATDYDDDDDSLIVSIESADYLDLDGDQLEDDILTEFTIAVPKGDWQFSRTFVYCELVLPSGYYFNFLIILIGSYNSVAITVGWYNTAIESGWYDFAVWSLGLGPKAPSLGFDWVTFDPPTEGEPGTPSIEIIEILAT